MKRFIGWFKSIISNYKKKKKYKKKIEELKKRDPFIYRH